MVFLPATCWCGRGLVMRRTVDIRLIVGMGLVVASVAGVYALVLAADQTTAVYVAADSLPAGSALSESDLDVIHVRLSAASPLYIEADSLPSDAIVTRSLRAGELVPRSVLGTVRDMTSTTVVLTVVSDLPMGVAPGESVDVWSAPQLGHAEFGAPIIMVSGATIARVQERSGIGSSAVGASVEVIIPRSKVAVVLQAQANGAAISLVPSVGGRQ